MLVKPNRNRRAILVIWAIGAIVPVALLLQAEVGKVDFSALWIAGQQVLSGDGASVYNSSIAQQYADRFTHGLGAEFPYPPHALFLFLPFALIPYLSGYLAWNAVSAIFFWWAARPYLPRGFPSILSILSPAAMLCLDFGQTGLLIGGLWLLAFQAKWPAVALLTIKPHIGMLSVLSLRSRTNFIRTAILAAALMAASAVLLGPQLWTGFADRIILHGDIAAGGERWRHASVSPAVAFGLWGWIPFAVGGGLLLARKVNVFTAATATFLIAPFGFHYDMPVASLGFGLLLYANWAKMPLKHSLPVALGFISPVIAILGVYFVCPILFWALWAQVKYDTGAFDGVGMFGNSEERSSTLPNGP